MLQHHAEAQHQLSVAMKMDELILCLLFYFSCWKDGRNKEMKSDLYNKDTELYLLVELSIRNSSVVLSMFWRSIRYQQHISVSLYQFIQSVVFLWFICHPHMFVIVSNEHSIYCSSII